MAQIIAKRDLLGPQLSPGQNLMSAWLPQLCEMLPMRLILVLPHAECCDVLCSWEVVVGCWENSYQGSGETLEGHRAYEPVCRLHQEAHLWASGDTSSGDHLSGHRGSSCLTPYDYSLPLALCGPPRVVGASLCRWLVSMHRKILLLCRLGWKHTHLRIQHCPKESK